MPTSHLLSQRGQTSSAQPESCSQGASQRAARGCTFGSKVSQAKSAGAQIARRDQTKISGAGFRIVRRGSSTRTRRRRGPTRCPTPTAGGHTGGAARFFTPGGGNKAPARVRPLVERVVGG